MLFFGVVWCGLNNQNTMKTTKKTINIPRLAISYDGDSESPRKDDGKTGYFFTNERNYKSPDGNTHRLYEIMMETADEAKDGAKHIELIEAKARAEFKASEPKDGNSHNEELHIIEIHPVYRYEHGGVSYKRGSAGGFDYSNCGFYIVTAQSISGETLTEEDIVKRIDEELAEYTQWANGEVYAFTLYDEKGEVEESCGGFYDIEDIRQHLPEDWKDERLEEYQTHGE